MSAYCNYIEGICEYGDHALKCQTRSAVACRTLREKIASEKSDPSDQPEKEPR